MRISLAAPITGILGVVLLCLPLVHLAGRLQAIPPARAPLPAVASPPRSPFDSRLQEAWRYWMRAQQAVNQQRAAMEDWDPASTEGENMEVWRRQQMACDRTGDLRRAREAADQAASLANTPLEAFRSGILLAHLDHESGNHQAELQQTRRLVAPASCEWLSLMYLRRAAICNGLTLSAEQTQGRLKALHKASVSEQRSADRVGL